MTIFNVSRNIVAGIAFTLLSFVAAQAGSIFTPTIITETGTQALCIANNVHTASVTVTAKLISSINVDTSKTCTLAAEDDAGCVPTKVYDNPQVRVRCVISISGLTNAQVRERVRGVLFYRFVNGADPIPLSVVEAD